VPIKFYQYFEKGFKCNGSPKLVSDVGRYKLFVRNQYESNKDQII
jgi:hypothetical protein